MIYDEKNSHLKVKNNIIDVEETYLKKKNTYNNNFQNKWLNAKNISENTKKVNNTTTDQSILSYQKWLSIKNYLDDLPNQNQNQNQNIKIKLNKIKVYCFVMLNNLLSLNTIYKNILKKNNIFL